MELCGAAMGADARASAKVTSERPPGILRSPRFAKMPEWRAGFMLPPPTSAKTPQRWPTLPRTKEAWPVGSRSGRAVAIDARATSARAAGQERRRRARHGRCRTRANGSARRRFESQPEVEDDPKSGSHTPVVEGGNEWDKAGAKLSFHLSWRRNG
jgi:hypothetical protein